MTNIYYSVRSGSAGYPVIIFCLVLFWGCGQPQSLESLEESINNRLAEIEGDFAIAFQNVSDSSDKLMINEREMFHAASTMKTPVMIEVFRQADSGRFSLDDSIQIKNTFHSIVDSSLYKMDIGEDSEESLYKALGERRSIRSLVDHMITSSSNLATNILIELVGADHVTQTMRSYGADSIKVLRGVEDIKAFEQGLSNRTNAHDEMIIYNKLARGQVVGPEDSGKMIEILKQQEFNEMIPAGLPRDTEVAHKTGWITGVNHDCGIVILPDGRRYVLVLLSKNAPEREQVVSGFSEISKLVYNYVIGVNKPIRKPTSDLYKMSL